MIKFVMMLLLMVAGTSAMAGECVNGNCTLRSRTVNVTREIIAVPVTVTRRTVQATRNVGSKVVNRCRSVVR
jgi:hypothetical protein